MMHDSSCRGLDGMRYAKLGHFVQNCWHCSGSEQLIFKAITNEVVECAPAVLPADLFAFSVRAAMIDDRHFVDASAEFGDFDSHLSLDAEAIGVQMHALKEVARENLVAGGDIVDGDAGEQIADDGEQPVKQESVVALHTMWTAMKAVAEDGVCVAFKNRLQQLRIIAGIVFEV